MFSGEELFFSEKLKVRRIKISGYKNKVYR